MAKTVKTSSPKNQQNNRYSRNNSSNLSKKIGLLLLISFTFITLLIISFVDSIIPIFRNK